MKEERERLGRMNILVATPGRILQHLDQASELDVGGLQMLVLDEADRIMDLGFASAVDAILEHLPKRQTLCFSATQTRRVSEMARLNVTDAEFVSVHEQASEATPTKLVQNYVVTPLKEKLDVLWSFLRANTKKKVLVFLSSGKQVRFVYEAFRRLQPGVPLLHLYGGQKQTARLEVVEKFSRASQVCLFATDVAARGLDFPQVDWVVQVDAPENAETYIHRVGRTARAEKEGRSILMVDPSEEEGCLEGLRRRKVEVEKIAVRAKMMQGGLGRQMQNMCFQDTELKYLGQKAFVNYVRSVYVMGDKETFKLKELDLEGFAASLGLPGAPRVKFLKGEDSKARKNMPRELRKMEESEEEKEEKPVVRTKYDRMFERRNQDVLAEHYSKMVDGEKGEMEDADEDEGFLAVKRRFGAGDEGLDQDVESESESDDDSDGENLEDIGINPASTDVVKRRIQLSNNPDEPALIVDSKRREKLLKSKKALLKFKGHGSHLVFSDDDEEGKEKVYYQEEKDFVKKGDAAVQRDEFLEAEAQRKAETDVVDKATDKQKRREKKEKRKEKERRLAEEEAEIDEDAGVQLAPYDEDDVEDEPQPKRKKKWFEQDSDDETENGSKRGKKSQDEQPQTLEDLEAMASGLLAR